MIRGSLVMASLTLLANAAGCRREANASAAQAQQQEVASREARLSSRQADTSGAASGAPIAQ